MKKTLESTKITDNRLPNYSTGATSNGTTAYSFNSNYTSVSAPKI